jgi:ribonuclease P protein component
MKRVHRLRKRIDFSRVYRRGISVSDALLVLYAFYNKRNEGFRFGVSVSKKVGGAVLRNKLRRQIKEIVRTRVGLDTRLPYDLVIIVRPRAKMKTFDDLEKSVKYLFKKANLV